MSNFISFAALLVSVAALVISLKKNINEKRLNIFQQRSDLMLRVTKLKFEFQQQAVRLHSVNKSSNDAKIQGIIDSYLRDADEMQKICDILENVKEVTELQILDLNNGIEKILLRTNSETEMCRAAGLIPK